MTNRDVLARSSLHLRLGLVVISLMVVTGVLSAATYYVATNGSDSNSGSIDHPWFSVKYALPKLMTNDTLYVREGVYYESGLSISGKIGIVIAAYPGEKVEITGGVRDFRAAPNDLWELYDAASNLYRSKATFPFTSYVCAWLLDDGIQLVQYASLPNLQSTNYGPVHGFTPMYQGPGVMVNIDGHLYIRLQNNPNDLVDPFGKPIAPIPADIDPNHHRISISFTGTLFTVSNSSNVKIRNLAVTYSKYLFDMPSSASNFEIDGCSFSYGIYAFVLRGTSSAPTARDFEIRNCDFNNGCPDYVYWCDVKNKDQEVGEAYPEFQSEAITGPAPGFFIHNNRFHDGFDGMDLDAGTDNARILYNEFYKLRDDAITFKIVGNVEVAHNIMWCVGEGVSCDYDITDTKTDGDVFVHHNIIDASHYQHGGREGNYRASNWPVWQICDVFGSHGDSYPAKWKVYNNTTVHRRSGYSYDPAELPAKTLSGPDLFVYNNIFLILDDRICYRGRLASSGAHYDGNVMFRLLDTTFHRPLPGTYPLISQFGNGASFNTLADFRASSGTNWEVHGMEADPLMDVNRIAHSGYEGGEATWKRYFPRNPAVSTQGVPYAGLNWPGTDGVHYRGAMVDSLAAGIGGDQPQRGTAPEGFLLEQNFPNPFNPATAISYELAASGPVSLEVFDLLGRKVSTLVSGINRPGAHMVRWDGSASPSGVYIYRLTAAGTQIAKTMVLLK